MLVSVDVVDLASIGWYVAVWPRTDEVLCHGESAKFVGCEAGLVKVDRSGGGVKESDVEFVAECAFHCGVDEFGAGHSGAVGESDNDVLAFAAGDFRVILEPDSNHGAVCRFDEPGAGAFD